MEVLTDVEITKVSRTRPYRYDRAKQPRGNVWSLVPAGDEKTPGSPERQQGSRWPGLNPTDACFDTVICNQDVLSANHRFLPKEVNEEFQRTRLDKLDPAISGFVMYLGVRKQFPTLEHHNIFFSDDYPAEFRQLFDERRPADEPTIYVAVHSKDDPDRAPPGCENWFVLVNAPALTDDARVDWPAIAQSYGDRVLERLETRFGLAGLRAHVHVRRHFTPADFQTRYLAHRGSLYGFASHGVRAAFQRPAMRPRGMDNFYFVGGSTHPGGGLPLVCLGGQMVADRILRGLGSGGRRTTPRW